MKIRQVGAELFHAHEQTDRHAEASSRVSQFCERAWKRNDGVFMQMLRLGHH